MASALLTRRRFCAGLVAATTLPAVADERSPVEVLDFDWIDTTRQRPVPVRLYRPARARREALSLAVFSHGIGGSRRGYSYLGRHWAEQGMASLHLQHVGSDRQLWIGNPLSLVGRLQGAAQEPEAIARVQDLRFALDRVLAGDADTVVDDTRIVAAGHSYGANTTLLAAGARVEREGRVIDLREPRIRAAIVLSAPPFYGEREPERILAGVRLPSLHVTATQDIINIPGYYSGADDRLRVFQAIGSTPKVLAVFDGGSHSIFTDRTNTGGSELNPQVKAATRELSWAFMRRVLDQDDSLLREWPQRHAAIVARYVGAEA